MIDLLYPIRHTDLWNYDELRFSLRSVQKYLSGVRDVWITGDKPEWLQNVRHIEVRDTSPFGNINILRKIIRACQEESLSEDFMFMNDDHILLKPESTDYYPFYHTGLLTDNIFDKKSGYYRIIDNTVSLLRRGGKNFTNFDTHTPIVYGKYSFPAIMKFYDWSEPGYVIKSLYCNTIGIEGTYARDCKITWGVESSEELEKIIGDSPVLSTDDRSFNPFMRSWLQNKFPDKSIWEK